jgi:hypothetical protein
MKKPTSEHKGLIELISRGVVDPQFRSELLQNPDKYAGEYQLSTNDTLALKNIKESEFEKAAAGVNMRPEWTIGIGFSGHFDAK